MSATAHHDPRLTDGTPRLEDLFTPAELRQFAEDDRTAGRRIGRILTSLFIYTLIAMSVVTWWTFRTVAR